MLGTSVQRAWCAKITNKKAHGAKVQPVPAPKRTPVSLSRSRCRWVSCVLKNAPCPSPWGSPYHHYTGRRVLEWSAPPWHVSAQELWQNAPRADAQNTSATAGGGGGVGRGTAYSERLEQIEMNFQIAPFFCQAPSYCFLGGGHWASGNSFARQARGAGSQRWRDCSAASTKDGHRWCARCLPCPRCPPASASPGGHPAMREAWEAP